MAYRTIHLSAGERANRRGKTKRVAACGTLLGTAEKLRPTLSDAHGRRVAVRKLGLPPTPEEWRP